MILTDDDEDRGGRYHRRPDFLAFWDNEEYHTFWAHFVNAEDSELIRRRPNPLDVGLHGVFFPTAKWFKDLCDVDLIKFAHLLRFHYYSVVPQDYEKIMPLSSSGSGMHRRLPDDFDMGRAFRDGVVQKSLVKLELDADDDEMPVQASPMKGGKHAALQILNKGFKQKVASDQQVNKAINVFSRYMKALFNHATELSQSEKQVEQVSRKNRGFPPRANESCLGYEDC